jgi:hypothetical protein
MEKNPFKILADNMQDFKKFDELAKQYPDAIRNQIERIEPWFHGSMKLVFNKAYGDTRLVLPANLTHLSDNGSEISVNTPEALITIPYEPGAKFQYSFVTVVKINYKKVLDDLEIVIESMDIEKTHKKKLYTKLCDSLYKESTTVK